VIDCEHVNNSFLPESCWRANRWIPPDLPWNHRASLGCRGRAHRVFFFCRVCPLPW